MSLFRRRPKAQPPAQPQQPETSTPADQPGPIDDTCRQLEAAYRRRTATRRNTRGT